MYEQPSSEAILFFMLYAGVAVLSAVASFYLLFRRANALAPDVKSSVCLRRWTGLFFAVIALSHAWYMPILSSKTADGVMQSYMIGGILDCLTVLPLSMVVMLSMLQDRRRPLWTPWILVAPLVAGLVLCAIRGNDALLPVLLGYFLILGMGFAIYMLCAVRQYGRWLRDNYADLEHKELWKSFMVLIITLLFFGIYASDVRGPLYKYAVQLSDVVVVCFLLWRVETLSDLCIQPTTPTTSKEVLPAAETVKETRSRPIVQDNIGPLLQTHCVDTKLYLQHDITLQQLAKAIGINRYYLSQHFSRQGTTYNAYINDLRINHFVRLYREVVSSHHPFTAMQLAQDSGYSSYSTFSLAFKQRMGQNVTEWMQHTKSLGMADEADA